MKFLSASAVVIGSAAAFIAAPAAWAQGGFRTVEEEKPALEVREAPGDEPELQIRPEPGDDALTLPRGTRVPLVLINSVSTKHASPGDKVYLKSVYPVIVDGRVMVPPGTYVSGSITSTKRPGRVKGKGELFLRFEQMILPNGVIRDLTGRVGALDGRSPEGFDKDEGKITSEGNKGGDTRTVAETTAAGAGIGTLAGAAAGRTGMGLGLGSAAGAAAGLASVLLTRGPDAILEKGAQLDMELDRDLFFAAEELEFEDPLRDATGTGDVGSGPDPNRNRVNRGSRFPI